MATAYEEYQQMCAELDSLRQQVSALEARNKELVEVLVYANGAMINIMDIVNSLREKEYITGSDLSLLDALCKALANQPTESEMTKFHIFHKWQNWVDVVQYRNYDGYWYKQTRVCSICNKRETRELK